MATVQIVVGAMAVLADTLQSRRCHDCCCCPVPEPPRWICSRQPSDPSRPGRAVLDKTPTGPHSIGYRYIRFPLGHPVHGVMALN